MNRQSLYLGLVLFAMGFLGVLSLLTITLPLDSLPPEILERFSEQTIQYLSLINPTLLLIVAILTGIALHGKVGLSVPTISALLQKTSWHSPFAAQLRYGIAGGVFAGILIVMVGAIFASVLPQEFIELGEKVQLSLAARFLYGGFTEEILLRFGFMTLVVWVIYKLSKKLNPTVYWLGIFIAALFFALGHFPVAYQAVPNPSAGLLFYILLGNTIGGFIFGWLYWKKGLEAAFIAHIMAHVVMLSAEALSLTP